jgi:AcrR family transcriptional regulator
MADGEGTPILVRGSGGPSAPVGGDGPRRSSLAQARSRRTREELVNAAARLWSDRGFENGPESTTVDEIAKAAGVTKGTFYFHFAHKEDVLLEMSIITTEAMAERAVAAADAGMPIDDVILAAFDEMARRTERMPRAAIGRTVRAFHQNPDRVRAMSVTRQVFPALFEQAKERGELPAGVDPLDLSDMLNALMITAVEGWVHDDHAALGPELTYRTRVLLAGVRAFHAR